MGQFSEHVVVITGAGSDIGRVISRQFSELGATVVLAGRSRERLESVAADIATTTSLPVLVSVVDISVKTQCERLFAEAVQNFGRVDVLINNAAEFSICPLLQIDEAMLSIAISTNVGGALFCGQAFASWVFANKRSGVIVNISSISGERSSPEYGLYSATKAALDSLTRSMAVEWTGRGVRVNGVAPGHVNTAGVRSDIATKRLNLSEMTRRIPARSIAEPLDLAELVVFLSGPQSRHMAGETIRLDGGQMAVL